MIGTVTLCRRCDGLVQTRLTVFGWVVALASAMILSAAIYWLQAGI
jgi:hypothetical protein